MTPGTKASHKAATLDGPLWRAGTGPCYRILAAVRRLGGATAAEVATEVSCGLWVARPVLAALERERLVTCGHNGMRAEWRVAT